MYQSQLEILLQFSIPPYFVNGRQVSTEDSGTIGYGRIYEIEEAPGPPKQRGHYATRRGGGVKMDSTNSLRLTSLSIRLSTLPPKVSLTDGDVSRDLGRPRSLVTCGSDTRLDVSDRDGMSRLHVSPVVLLQEKEVTLKFEEAILHRVCRHWLTLKDLFTQTNIWCHPGNRLTSPHHDPLSSLS